MVELVHAERSVYFGPGSLQLQLEYHTATQYFLHEEAHEPQM